MKKNRDVWVDNVKVIACILVVLGHFYQSMVKANILPDNVLYHWFDDTIYYFHVPLFFICSGFLYQKYLLVNTLNSWRLNILKKALALGIPYFVFSIATWILKKIFASSVNTQLGGIFDTLFMHPASPYWYLYILFIIFFITKTTKNTFEQIVLLLIGVALKASRYCGFATGLYFIDKTMDSWIWFIWGMTMAYGFIHLVNKKIGIFLFLVFLLGSTLVGNGILQFRGIAFILALLACYSVISVVYSCSESGIQNKCLQFLTKYTMPIFLMHTLFAATFRSILMKIGIFNAVAHVVLGLLASFIGPVIAMIIMERIKPLDFIVYPTRYVKIEKGVYKKWQKRN